ncbi:NACHT, LRR and PYD domains-containing protein 12-like [Scyliorhinus canicula]|uniref:NACHT, LRR and PYD domains-containing protein 12-like n=1 Tax=Scyliorhinus canicula TaxID=7830 RepID=UPI0018F2D30A|nr:NACHT, LRR and PYD domains-containing protein 12-like [Scyliorhinus canicula]
MADLQEAERQHKETLLKVTEWMDVLSEPGRAGKQRFVPLADSYTPLIVVDMIPDSRPAIGHELSNKWRVQEESLRALEGGSLAQLDLGVLLSGSSREGSEVSRGLRAALAGVAGSGKSTALRKLARDWASGLSYPQFRFLFPFRFRDLNSRLGRRTSLKALLVEAWAYLADVVDALWSQAEHLLFTFDGLDEFGACLDLGGGSGGRTEDGKEEIPGIVGGLLRGTTLPGCTVLITGRPSALRNLEEARVVDTWAAILGFSATERSAHLEMFLGNARLALQVLRHLDGQGPVLGAMGHEAMSCQLAAASLGPSLVNRAAPGAMGSPTAPPLPKTVTQLLTSYLLQVVRGYGRGITSPRDTFFKLGKLALDALGRGGSALFSGELLATHRLKAAQFAQGYLAEILVGDEVLVARGDGADSVHAFRHPTLQDFLAALALYLAPPPGDNISALLTQARCQPDGRYQLFLRFVAGLSTPGAGRPLEEALGQLQARTATQASAWLKAEILEKGGRNGLGLLGALYELLETQSKRLVQTSLGSLEVLRLGEGRESCQQALSLTSMDCTVLSSLIHLSEALEELDLENCQITSEGLARLSPAFHRCKILRLNNVKLGDPGVAFLAAALKKPKCKLQMVGLVNNGLTEVCAGDLSAALTCNDSLRKLQLRANSLGDRGLKTLCGALGATNCKLQSLDVNGNGLTGACAEDLACLLGESGSLLELDIGVNALDDAGVIVLCASLQRADCKLQTLHLDSNNLSDACAPELSSVLIANTSLLAIDLNSNKLEDLGVQYLCTALRRSDCRIQKLGLASNGLTDFATEGLVSSLSGKRSLRSLDLRGNFFSDRSVTSIQGLIEACPDLEEIRLKGNRFTSDGKNRLDLMNESGTGPRVDVQHHSPRA